MITSDRTNDLVVESFHLLDKGNDFIKCITLGSKKEDPSIPGIFINNNRVYFFPARDYTLTGPKRSMWRSWRGELTKETCLDIKLAFVFFPFSQAEQRDSFAKL